MLCKYNVYRNFWLQKKQITLRRFRSCEDLRSNFNDKDHIIQDNAPIKMTPKVVKEVRTVCMVYLQANLLI